MAGMNAGGTGWQMTGSQGEDFGGGKTTGAGPKGGGGGFGDKTTWSDVFDSLIRSIQDQMGNNYIEQQNLTSSGENMPFYMDVDKMMEAAGVERWMQQARNRAIVGLPVTLNASIQKLTKGGTEPAPEGMTERERRTTTARATEGIAAAGRQQGGRVASQGRQQLVAALAEAIGRGTASQAAGAPIASALQSKQEGQSRLTPLLQMLSAQGLMLPPQGQTVEAKKKSKTHKHGRTPSEGLNIRGIFS